MISSLTLPRLAAGPAPAPAPAPAAADLRPNVEWWEVGDKSGDRRYESTADLVKNYTPGQGGAPALYHWRQETSFGKPEMMKAARDGAVNGLIGGAVLGGILGIGINVMGVIGTVMTAGMMGIFGGMSLVGPIVACAVGGAIIGAISGPGDAKAAFESGTVVQGTLQPELQADGSQHLEFFVNGQVADKVDLNRYASAQPGPVPADGPKPWWATGGYVPIND